MQTWQQTILLTLIVGAGALILWKTATSPAIPPVAYTAVSAGGETFLFPLADGEEPRYLRHTVLRMQGDCLTFEAVSEGPVASADVRLRNGRRWFQAPATSASSDYATGEFIRFWNVTLRSNRGDLVRYAFDAPHTPSNDGIRLRRLPFCPHQMPGGL